jgi:hypothetical protein
MGTFSAASYDLRLPPASLGRAGGCRGTEAGLDRHGDAQRLGVSRAIAYELVKRGMIPSLRPVGPMRAFDALIDSRPRDSA